VIYIDEYYYLLRVANTEKWEVVINLIPGAIFDYFLYNINTLTSDFRSVTKIKPILQDCSKEK
jgi:hypothetical protein